MFLWKAWRRSSCHSIWVYMLQLPDRASWQMSKCMSDAMSVSRVPRCMYQTWFFSCRSSNNSFPGCTNWHNLTKCLDHAKPSKLPSQANYKMFLQAVNSQGFGISTGTSFPQHHQMDTADGAWTQADICCKEATVCCDSSLWLLCWDVLHFVQLLEGQEMYNGRLRICAERNREACLQQCHEHGQAGREHAIDWTWALHVHVGDARNGITYDWSILVLLIVDACQ